MTFFRFRRKWLIERESWARNTRGNLEIAFVEILPSLYFFPRGTGELIKDHQSSLNWFFFKAALLDWYFECLNFIPSFFLPTACIPRESSFRCFWRIEEFSALYNNKRSDFFEGVCGPRAREKFFGMMRVLVFCWQDWRPPRIFFFRFLSFRDGWCIYDGYKNFWSRRIFYQFKNIVYK